MASHSTRTGAADQVNPPRRVECPEPVEGLSYVYMLRLQDHRIYTGVTNNPSRRFGEHRRQSSAIKTTHDAAALGLIYLEKHPSRESALKREQQLKKWSRSKKEALASGDITLLRRLATCRNSDRRFEEEL
jgi:predicted GIY-YIG superfamily endonuclease